MQIDHLDGKHQCQHQGCSCAVLQDEQYCSEHCRKAAQSAPTREEDRVTCACGHDECADKQ